MSSIYDPQSQRNPAWAGHPLGHVAGATIGAYGCFITVAAMILTHYLGRPIDPVDVDDAMDALGLYIQGDLWPDGALPTLYGHFGGQGAMVEEGPWDFVGKPADLSTLAMDDTQERLIVIDFDHNPADGIQTHALRAFSGSPIVVDDPWYGTRDPFTLHYGANPALTIQKVVGYKVPGFVPFWKRPVPPPAPPPPVVVPVPPAYATAVDLEALRARVVELETFRKKVQTA